MTHLEPRGRSQTTLTKFCPVLTTYPPSVDICEGIRLLKKGKNHIGIQLTFSVPPTYLPRLANVVCEYPPSKPRGTHFMYDQEI